MGRKNFTQQLDQFDIHTESEQSDNLTDEIVERLDNTVIEETPIAGIQESKYTVRFADADMFIPYHDEQLRLQLRTGEEKERLLESIKKNGVLDPVNAISSPTGKLEILQGHNRVAICKELNIQVPYILRDDLDENGQILIVIDTNILNRQNSDIAPTQFGYILKKKFDAEKHQGQTLGTEFTKLTGDKLGEEYGLSRKMISVYIKLNDLVDIAKKSTDSKEISIKTAYELSFLPAEIQTLIINLLNEYMVNDKMIHSLRLNLEDKYFANTEDMVAFVKGQLEEKHSQKRTFDYRNVRKYLPKEIAESEVEDYIIKAIKAYRGY